MHAFPLRLREQTIGALNLFGHEPGEMPADDRQVARALADVATIGILQERALRRSEVLTEQLQTALNSRVVIEQAKGMLAERGGIDVDDAFAVLGGHARDRGVRLSTTALDMVEGRLDPLTVLSASDAAR